MLNSFNQTKQTKKSKHGKKNWRKNIDVSELEKANNLKANEKFHENKIAAMKDDELFKIEIKPQDKLLGRKRNADQNLLKSKETKDSKTKKKVVKSKVDEILVKRIKTSRNIEKEEELNKQVKEEKKAIERDGYDMWGSESNNEKKGTISLPSVSKNEIKYPSVPLPHPGQSYNPSRNDLKKLLSKVVSNNVKVEKKEEKTIEIEVKKFEDHPSDDESVDPDEPISNNPATKAEDKLTKTQRNKLKKKNENKRKNEEQLKKKKQKIDIYTIKESKNFEVELTKEQRKKQLEEEKKKMAEKELKRMIESGVIDDPELIEDFQLKKEGTQSLRNLKINSNLIRDKFDNLLKRKILGEVTVGRQKRRNSKLNKYTIRNNPDFFVDEDDAKLKIYN